MNRKAKVFLAHSGCKAQEDVVLGLVPPPAAPCKCKLRVTYEQANDYVKTGQASWVIVAKKPPVLVKVQCSVCAPLVSKKDREKCGVCKGTEQVEVYREIPVFNNDIVMLSTQTLDSLGTGLTPDEEKENRKHRYGASQKTPRVPTIERPHIENAYAELAKKPEEFREDKRRRKNRRRDLKKVFAQPHASITAEDIRMAYELGKPFEDNYAAQRIEEYGNMNQEELGSFGAQLRIFNPVTLKSDVVHDGNPEPKNKRIAYPPGSITFKDGTTNKNWWWELDGRDVDYGRSV